MKRATALAFFLLGACAHGYRADLAIAGAKVFREPGVPPLENALLVWRDGRIVFLGAKGGLALDPSVPVIDGSGASVVAGLWDPNAQFLGTEWEDARLAPPGRLAALLQAHYTLHGFTSLVARRADVDEAPSIRARTQAGTLDTPRLFLPEEAGRDPPALAAALRLRAFEQAGGRALFELFLGERPPSEDDVARALERLRPLGFDSVLAALTLVPATAFGAAARLGAIGIGKEADLVLVEGDPAKDLTALARVLCTVLRGRVVHRIIRRPQPP